MQYRDAPEPLHEDDIDAELLEKIDDMLEPINVYMLETDDYEKLKVAGMRLLGAMEPIVGSHPVEQIANQLIFEHRHLAGPDRIQEAISMYQDWCSRQSDGEQPATLTIHRDEETGPREKDEVDGLLEGIKEYLNQHVGKQKEHAIRSLLGLLESELRKANHNSLMDYLRNTLSKEEFVKIKQHAIFWGITAEAISPSEPT